MTDIFTKALEQYKEEDDVPSILKAKKENPLVKLVKQADESKKAITIPNVSTLRHVKDNGKRSSSDKVRLVGAVRKAAEILGIGVVVRELPVEGKEDLVNVHFKTKEKKPYNKKTNVESEKTPVESPAVVEDNKVAPVPPKPEVKFTPNPKPSVKPIPHAGRR